MRIKVPIGRPAFKGAGSRGSSMNEPLWIWTKLFLRLGFVLLGVGLIPVALTATILTGIDPLIPVMLSLSVAPLGLLCLLAALILFLAALLRRPSGPS